MAFVYENGLADIVKSVIDGDGATLKLMLVNSTYTATKSDAYIGSGAGSCGAAEITATNYTGGFGGAGRKSAARSVSVDSTNHVVRIIFAADFSWTALGGATNDTIAAAVLVKEGTSDADSRLIAYFNLATALTTNGSDITLTRDATLGQITFTV